MINSVRWVTHQTATGLKDLPRNSAWLLSKALAAPVSGIRRMGVTAADSLQNARETVEGRLKNVEAAISRSAQAEQDALTATQHVKALADAAIAADEAGMERIRQAECDAGLEVERRTQSAREHFAQLLSKERQKAVREAEKTVGRVRADVRGVVDRAREVAQAAAEMARQQIDNAREQSTVAQSLAAGVTASAQRAATQVHQQAEAIAQYARRRAKVADAAVEKARRTQASLRKGAGPDVGTEQAEVAVIVAADAGDPTIE